jgi:hypothetical protein
MPLFWMLRGVALIITDVSEDKNQRVRSNVSSVHQLLVTGNVVPSLSIRFTLMIEAIRSSETSVLTSATRRHSP